MACPQTLKASPMQAFCSSCVSADDAAVGMSAKNANENDKASAVWIFMSPFQSRLSAADG
jgi:hypothetical protein